MTDTDEIGEGEFEITGCGFSDGKCKPASELSDKELDTWMHNEFIGEDVPVIYFHTADGGAALRALNLFCEMPLCVAMEVGYEMTELYVEISDGTTILASVWYGIKTQARAICEAIYDAWHGLEGE